MKEGQVISEMPWVANQARVPKLYVATDYSCANEPAVSCQSSSNVPLAALVRRGCPGTSARAAGRNLHPS